MPVLSWALVGAVGHGVAAGEAVGAHVGRRQVVLDGKPGLEQQLGPAGLRHHLAVVADDHMTGAGTHVDAVVRVAGVGVDGLVLFEPGLELVVGEGQVAGQRWCALERAGVRPHHVLELPILDPQRPVGGISLERTVGGVVGREQVLLANIVLGEVVDGQETALVQDLGTPAVDHHGVADHTPHPGLPILPVEDVGRTAALEVELAGRLRPERAGAEGEGHGCPPGRCGRGGASFPAPSQRHENVEPVVRSAS